MTISAYDQLPFVSFPSPERHPERIATIANFFGLNPKAVDQARVLELGCSTGAHLISMASYLPQAKFYGIDYSATQIEIGKKQIAFLKLKNIELNCCDLIDFVPELEKFDYIICHGIFSWVTHPLQEKIFQIISGSLSAEGVACVSYNCTPGWNARGALRDLLRANDRPEQDCQQRITRVRDLIKIAAEQQIDDYTPYGMLLREELVNLTQQSDAYLLHEMLAEVNQPLLFKEFIQRAAQQQLQYLGDSRFSRIRFDRLVGSDLLKQDIDREQFFDTLFPQALRSTLLCQKSVAIQRSISVQTIMKSYLSSPLRAIGNVSFMPEQTADFTDPRDRTISATDPLVKAALVHLSEAWPGAVPVDFLISEASRRSGAKIEAATEQQFVAEMLSYLSQGVVEISSYASRFSKVLPVKPKATACARLQAKDGNWVTTLRHEYLVLDQFESHVLQLLDGTKNTAQLEEDLASNLLLGITEDGSEIKDYKHRREIIAEQLPDVLKKFAESAIFPLK